jgi:hypothetical protein
MSKITENLRKASWVITTAVSAASIHSYVLNLQDNTMKKVVASYLEEKQALANTIAKLSEDNRISEIRKADFLRSAQAEADKLQRFLDKLNEGKHETATSLIKKEQVDWTSSPDDSLAGLYKLMAEYKGSGSGSGSSSHLIDSFNSNLIEELQQAFQSYLEWFNSLPLAQQGALTHIVVSVTTLISLSSLVTVFYSDYLIKRFNVESKFPRLAKYISMRRTFQQYYFLLNTVVIVLFSLIMIALNIYVFIIS